MLVNYGYLHQQFAEVTDYFEELQRWVFTGEFTLGPYVEKFEKKFADYLGVKYVISTNTGTDALILALKASGIKSGDEVITVTNTFYATVGAIVATGAKPVFVDCDERMQINPNLIEKAIKLREYFSPYVFLYVDLLIEDNKLLKAKKFLQKAWLNSPHPDFKTKIKLLSNKMKIPYFQLAEFVVGSSKKTLESKILLAEALIDSQKWTEAKKQLNTLLEHKPSRKVCLLMSKIEEGDSNDPQKVNAWISRSNFGDLNKIWICRISNVSQEKWTSVSNSGYFNSLEWKKPTGISKLSSSNIETNIINYINN